MRGQHEGADALAAGEDWARQQQGSNLLVQTVRRRRRTALRGGIDHGEAVAVPVVEGGLADQGKGTQCGKHLGGGFSISERDRRSHLVGDHAGYGGDLSLAALPKPFQVQPTEACGRDDRGNHSAHRDQRRHFVPKREIAIHPGGLPRTCP